MGVRTVKGSHETLPIIETVFTHYYIWLTIIVIQGSGDSTPILKILNNNTDVNTTIYIHMNMNSLGEWSVLFFDLSLLVLGTVENI